MWHDWLKKIEKNETCTKADTWLDWSVFKRVFAKFGVIFAFMEFDVSLLRLLFSFFRKTFTALASICFVSNFQINFWLIWSIWKMLKFKMPTLWDVKRHFHELWTWNTKRNIFNLALLFFGHFNFVWYF